MRSIPRLLTFLVALPFAGCAATPELSEHASERELAAALERELAARAQAATAARRSSDPWDLWLACLATSAPDVIAARHELAAARARAQSLGAPDATFDVEYAANGSDRQTQFMLAFDLPALVGAGRAGAARARAEVDAARADAALFAARFGAQHALERALAALAVARSLDGDLAQLEAEAAGNARRLELLERRGWLPPDQVATARTMLHHVSAMRLEQAAATAAARAEVATLSGLAPGSPWLDDPDATGLLAITQRTWGRTHDPGSADPDAATLLHGQPELRLARFDYLAAEADVRSACAARWPGLMVGPNVMLTPDDLLLGGVLRLELPWPPAAGAAVDAARAARDAARDALVSELARVQNRIAQRRAEQAAATLSLREHGEEVVTSSGRTLRSAQARFAIEPAALTEWSMAIDQRARALATRAAALQRWLVATFDLSEALGAPPAAPESPSPPTSEEGAR